MDNNDFLSEAKIEKIITSKCSCNEKCLYKIALYKDNNRRLTTMMLLFSAGLFLCEAIVVCAVIHILYKAGKYLTEITFAELVFRILFMSAILIPLGIHMILRANKIKACGKIPQYYVITNARFLKISIGFILGAHTFVSMHWKDFEKASCYGFNSVILTPKSDELCAITIDTNSAEEAVTVAELINRLIKC